MTHNFHFLATHTGFYTVVIYPMPKMFFYIKLITNFYNFNEFREKSTKFPFVHTSIKSMSVLFFFRFQEEDWQKSLELKKERLSFKFCLKCIFLKMRSSFLHTENIFLNYIGEF